MKNRSIATNAFLNAIKTICSIVFPLITFPYVSRVLQVESLGNYNFCTSVISYVTLVAGLGINTYAVREGARCRNDSSEMSKFASELFTINLFSTAIAYGTFFVLLTCFSKLQQNSTILLILGISVVFQTIGCDWIFSIYEDFGYITLRSVVFQILSLVLLFVFVRTKEDIIPYAIISVIANSGANVINVFAKRKYCRVKIVLNKTVLKRIVPILILFANTLATNIYINSDMTMVGAISGDYYAGLYAVSSKLYFILKNLLSAIIVVSIPRLSAHIGNNENNHFSELATNIFSALLVLVTPMVVGLFSIAPNVIIIIAGKEYIGATTSLRLLAIALLFCLFGWFYNSCVLIPFKQDKKVLFATVISAIVNVLLNLLLIPMWAHNAAAATTLIAEFMCFVICFWNGKKYYNASINKKDLLSVVLANVLIIVICKVIDSFCLPVYLSVIISVAFSSISYFLVLKILKNSAIQYVEKMIVTKVMRK